VHTDEQAEYDQTIAPLNEEKDELTKTIPVLEMIDKMVQEILAEQAAAAGKAKGVQQLALKSVPKAKLSALRCCSCMRERERERERERKKWW